jgi:hypothetical protein
VSPDLRATAALRWFAVVALRDRSGALQGLLAQHARGDESIESDFSAALRGLIDHELAVCVAGEAERLHEAHREVRILEDELRRMQAANDALRRSGGDQP